MHASTKMILNDLIEGGLLHKHVLWSKALVLAAFTSQLFAAESYPSTMNELLERSKQKNFAVREEAEIVYRARKQVTVKLGQLLPNLNFGTVVALPQQSPLDFAGGVLGFLFPSHWFAWNESRLFHEAERRFFSVVIANEVNLIHGLVYQINSVKNLSIILNDIEDDISGLKEIAEDRLRYGEDSAENYFFFKNMLQKIAHDQIEIRASVVSQVASLGYALGYSQSEIKDGIQWPHIDLPDLSRKTSLDVETVFKSAKKRSLERKGLTYLQRAEKYSRYERTFAFISADRGDDSGLGFGYKSYLRIGRSKQRTLAIEMDKLEARLFERSSKLVSDDQLSLDLYANSVQGLCNANAWLALLRQRYLEGGDLEPMNYTEAITSVLSFASHKSQAQHGYLIAKAQLKRLRWDDELYGDLYKLKPSDDLTHHERESGSMLRRFIHRLKRKLEDRKSK